jgi:MYXO-CTERM domain-containing protein
MKKTHILLSLALAGLYSGLNAHASVLFQDGFNYTAGDQLGAGSTTGVWTGTTSPNSVITNVNLTYSGMPDPGGNSLALLAGATQGAPESAVLSSSQTSGSIYYSFLVECTALPTANTYLTALTPTAKPGPNGNTTDAMDFYAKNSGAGWVLGERTTGTSAVYESTVLSLNTAYLVVLEYTFGGNAQLFFDPTPGAAQPTATLTQTPTSYVTDVSDVGFKAQTATTIGNFVFDNMLVGTTWADVTPTATPEPGPIALAGLGALALVFARRFRR